MANFVNEENFSTGNVEAASYTRRPDAIVSLVDQSPGPMALEDATSILVKGWYVRPDTEGGTDIILGESNPGTGEWTETTLDTAPGALDKVALAFDAEGHPVVAMEVAGAIHVRYWDGATYTTIQAVANGTNPTLVNRSPDTDFSHVVLFYQTGQSILYRFMSEDFGVEYNPETTLAAEANLEKAIEGAGGRLHLAYSVWDEVAETYSVDWYSSPVYNPACLLVDGEEETIPLGTESIFVFRADATIETRCDLECDFLIIGAGGNSGSPTQGRSEDSVVWMDGAGNGLDPQADTAVYRAYGGGHGAPNDTDGSSGGSGGGGGGSSPSNNSMWTTGGQATGGGGQGNPGGGGQSTWGLLDPKRAASGGGGGSGISGTGGTCLQGTPLQAGKGGAGKELRDWNWDGPKGGDGFQIETTDPSTGSVPGGGGAGGVIELLDFSVPAGQTIPIRVGQAGGGGNAGEGGKWGFDGVTGLVAVKIRRVALNLVEPAKMSGGVETVLDDYRYHTFLVDGTLVVDSPGKVEAVVIGGGGGGGSDAGGGGGAGDIREVALAIQVDSAVQVGDGGAGGTGGGTGANGEASSFAEIVAPGGGGGAGAGATAGSDATGGGGHGNEGAPGAGRAMRGYPGGPGGGYDLSAGGSARHAGGGGGVSDSGDNGATQELTGSPLSDNWGTPALGSLLVDQQRYRLTVDGGTDKGLLGSNVSTGKMFVQGLVVTGHGNLNVGIMARAEYPTGDDEEAPVGYFNWIDEGDQRWRSLAYLFSLGSEHVLQTYVEDGLQEYSVVGVADGQVLTDSGTDTGHDAQNDRTFGVRCQGSPISGTNKQGYFDDLMCFRDKLLTVGNMPTGGILEVLAQDGTVVNSAPESGGQAQVDLSVFTTGEPLVVPNTGFPRCRVKDSGGTVVVDVSGIFFPGAEFDVNGGDLDIRVDNTGPEPVPILGLLQGTDFSELTPGPLRGAGGDGRDLPEDWVAATGINPAAGGGGGGGAEIQVAGPGGQGGGGAGAFGTGTPEDGTPNTGGGGGGSGDTSVAGGAGGSGLVVVRADRNPLDTPDGTRFSDSGIDQDVDGALLLDHNTEVVSFGDNTDLNSLTAFTLVLRFQPDFLNTQRYVWSRWDAANNKRQAGFFQRNNGVELALAVSQTGADAAVLWNTTGWKGTDSMYAMAYDGSLGGVEGQDRLRAYRREPAGSWVDIGWDFSFFSGRSDVPTSLVSISGVRELLCGREDGADPGSPGKLRLMAFKAGQMYTPVELDAMTLEDTPNVDPADWDRLYRFATKANVADEIGGKHGSFEPSPA